MKDRQKQNGKGGEEVKGAGAGKREEGEVVEKWARGRRRVGM
jgi:hypothetical protein